MLELLILAISKKPNKLFMKKLSTTTVESKATLAESLIEDHINSMHHPDKCVDENVFSEKFANINWCCEHSPLQGTVEISFSDRGNGCMKHISIPVTTSFWVICTKENERNYKVAWSCSLS